MQLKSKQKTCGFTLVEIMITVAIVGILQAFAVSSYTSYLERVDIAQAIIDMESIERRVELFYMETGMYPDSLSQVNGEMTDPWGNPYVYLGFSGVIGNAGKRKDKNLVPINSDFDLYSKGKDGQSVAALTAPQSHDDVIRASDGSFLGLASNF